MMNDTIKKIKEQQENMEKECIQALSDIITKYGMKISCSDAKNLIQFICILKSEGIETPEQLNKLIVLYKKQMKK